MFVPNNQAVERRLNKDTDSTVHITGYQKKLIHEFFIYFIIDSIEYSGDSYLNIKTSKCNSFLRLYILRSGTGIKNYCTNAVFVHCINIKAR